MSKPIVTVRSEGHPLANCAVPISRENPWSALGRHWVVVRDRRMLLGAAEDLIAVRKLRQVSPRWRVDACGGIASGTDDIEAVRATGD